MRLLANVAFVLVMSGRLADAATPSTIQSDWQRFYRFAGHDKYSQRYAIELLFDVVPMLKRQKTPIRIQPNGKAFSAVIWRTPFPANTETHEMGIVPQWERSQLPSVFPSNFVTIPGDLPTHAYFEPRGTKLTKAYCRQWLVGDCAIRLTWKPHVQTTLMFYQYGRAREADFQWLERTMNHIDENDPIAQKH